MGFWTGRYVVVTGGKGFLGKHLAERLAMHGAYVIALDSRDGDLRLREAASNAYGAMPTNPARTPFMFHLAARVSGIGAIGDKPASTIYDNLMMGLQILQAAVDTHFGGKIVMVGSVCAYPKYTPQPMLEENLWEGYPEETNGPYGVAKRALTVAAEQYVKQYGIPIVSPLLANLYGEGDDFHPHTSHVIPALFRKMIIAREQRQPEVVVWGSGQASRDFLYVHDAVEALMRAAEVVEDARPFNIATSTEMPISGLVEIIKRVVGYRGKIVYDRSKPDGQPRRCLNTRRAQELLGWKAKTGLEDGLRNTYEWYEPILLDELREEAREKQEQIDELRKAGFRV